MRSLIGNQKCVVSVLLTILIVLGMYGTGYADVTPVSDRTRQIPRCDCGCGAGCKHRRRCDRITPRSNLPHLNLREKGITALKAGDFEGLSSLRLLTLQNNNLTSLPAGVFDDLSDLTQLHLYTII